MDYNTHKPKPKKKNSTFVRPSPEQPKKPQNTKSSLKDKFDLEIIQKNPWGQFLLFVEDFYGKYIPPSTEDDKKLANILQSAIKTFNQHHQESWRQILHRIPPSSNKVIDDFYYYLSNRRKLTPQEVYQESQAAIQGLINNAEYGFIHTDNKDIGRISQLSDAINYFQKHRSKTYLVLSQLEAYVPEDAKKFFAASQVFQGIIASGAHEILTDFGMALMKHFKVTRTAIKDETAKNLVSGIGEIERQLKTQISILEAEKLELTRELQQLREQGHQEIVTQIAQELQNGSQRALDQIQKIISLIQPQIEASGEAQISSDDALAIFIVLRNLMTIFQKLGIETYPKSLKDSFTISQVDLAKYAYVGGTPFTNYTEIKQVQCIQKGWKVNDNIITPAKVQELTDNSTNN